MPSSTQAGAHGLAERRGFLFLLGEEVISGIGSMMTALALPWFVLQTTGSASRVSVVLAAEGAPVLLLGIPGGTVAARLGAKRTRPRHVVPRSTLSSRATVSQKGVQAIRLGFLPFLVQVRVALDHCLC